MTLSIISGQSNNSKEMESEWEGQCQMYSLNNSGFACHSYQITAGGGKEKLFITCQSQETTIMMI